MTTTERRAEATAYSAIEVGRAGAYSAQACAWKKVTEPAACHEGVQRAQAGFAVSQRRACRTLRVPRATLRSLNALPVSTVHGNIAVGT